MIINEEEKSKSPWEKIKSRGVSGIISYVITEITFWAIFPFLLFLFPSDEQVNSQNNDSVS